MIKRCVENLVLLSMTKVSSKERVVFFWIKSQKRVRFGVAEKRLHDRLVEYNQVRVGKVVCFVAVVLFSNGFAVLILPKAHYQASSKSQR